MSKHKQYTREYKLEILELVDRSDKPIAEVEREMGITPGLIHKWRRAYQDDPAPAPQPPAEIIQETISLSSIKPPERKAQVSLMPDDNALSLNNKRQPRKHRSRTRTITRAFRHSIRRIRWSLVIIGTLAVIAIIVVGALIVASDAANRVDTSWKALERIMRGMTTTAGNDLTLEDYERLQIGLEELSNALASGKQQTGFLRILANLNSDLNISFQLLDIANELAMASENTLAGLEPALFFLTSGSEDRSVVTQVSSGERVAELLRLGRGRFLEAAEHLAAAEAIWSTVTYEDASSDLLLTTTNLRSYNDQIQEINDVLLDAPDLLTVALGLDEEQHYLVISQNNDEIRPSGGYISTYGWLVVRNARIVDHDYAPTTPTSPVPPPAAFADTLSIPTWWFQFDDPVYAAWDGSWYPDFPSTAEMAARYYDAGGNPQSPIDGVIGIDITGFEYILEGLGSVVVEGYDETVTPADFREIVYGIRQTGNAELAHKQFLAALYKQILTDWRAIDREQGVQLVGATLRALQEKHIMLYFRDDPLNNAVEALHWSGKQTPGDYDYLMVADANLTNKSNRSIIRQLTYDVAIQTDGTLESYLAISYDYPAQLAETDPAVNPAHYGQIDYYNLLQVFVPAGSTLTNTDNLRHIPEEHNTDAFASYVELVQVAYNSGERIQFSYVTPALIETIGQYKRYRLLVQKQPGMLRNAVSIQVILPEDAEVISASPQEVASYMLGQTVLEFQLVMTTDQWVEVIYAEQS